MKKISSGNFFTDAKKVLGWMLKPLAGKGKNLWHRIFREMNK
jgi:hypothetical protein